MFTAPLPPVRVLELVWNLVRVERQSELIGVVVIVRFRGEIDDERLFGADIVIGVPDAGRGVARDWPRARR